MSQKLIDLGAQQVISREEAFGESKGVLGKELWAAVVDPVGGSFTAQIVKQVQYGGSVALSGLTAGGNMETTVYPFILRGVNLLGIDSVVCPNPLREQLWQRLAGEWKPESALSQMIEVYALEDLPKQLSGILEGKAVGRSVISLQK
ncbi:putative quinone oxidoreductase YhfP [compost metagenome]